MLEAGDGFAERVHAGSALLGVWIADDPETARRLFELGADAVATNDPRTIVPIRDEVAAYVFRRKELRDDLRRALGGLRAVVAEVEAAKDAMTVDGAVDADAAERRSLKGSLELEEHLGRGQLGDAGVAASTASRTNGSRATPGIVSRSGAPRQLREDPPELGGFEGLIWAVDQLLAPLEAFEAAAERFRTLRR